MVSKLTAWVAAVMLTVAGAACAEPAAQSKFDMVIHGPITKASLAPLTQALAKSVLQGTTPKEVSIVINSPGGEVGAGGVFITWMRLAQAKGTRFVCYVPGMAASMAFSVLMACDERHATSNAQLLWHRARVGIMMALMKGPDAQNLGYELLDTDNAIIKELDRTLGEDMEHEEIMRFFEAETMHSGSAVHKLAPHFIDVQTIIPGAIEALFDTSLLRTAPSEDRRVGKPGQLLYIYEGAVEFVQGVLTSVFPQ